MIDNGRVQLRPLEPGDVDRLWEIISEPEVCGNIMPDPAILTRSNFLGVLTGADPNARVFTVREWQKSGDIIGITSLAHFNMVNHSATIPVTAINREMKGHGFGVEVARTLVRYGFRQLGLHRISYVTWVDESHAKAHAKLKGAIYEGTQRHAGYRDGQWIDCHLFAYINAEG